MRDAVAAAGAGARITRRGMVGLALCAPWVVLAARACAQAVPACVDLDALPLAQKSLRRTLGFKLQSPDPKRRCGGCSFFKATAGACGACQLLSGGAVFSTSVCDSWAARAGS